MATARNSLLLRTVVLVVHYAILAATALAILTLKVLGGIDVPHALSAAEVGFLGAIAGYGLLLYVPTAIFIVTRRSAPLTALAIVPPLANLAFVGFCGLKIAAIDARETGRVIASPVTLGTQTIPAGSTVGRTTRGHSLITLASGRSYAGLPLVGRFEVDDEGNFVSGAAATIAHDVSASGVACSSHEPVSLAGREIVGCAPVAGTTIDGVPCAPSAVATFAGAIGKRAQCEIAQPYRFHDVVWPAGTRIDVLMDRVTVGPSPPHDVRFRGGSLPAGAVLEFDSGKVAVAAGGLTTSSVWYCQTPRPEQHCNQQPLTTRDFNIGGRRFAR